MHDSDTQKLLEAAAVDIYSRLVPSLRTADGEALMMIMADSACIWTGSGFASTSRVVMQLSESFGPWILSVPSCLEPYAALLLCLGVCLSRQLLACTSGSLRQNGELS